MLYSRWYEGRAADFIPCYIPGGMLYNMLHSRHLPLNVPLAGSPRYACPHTAAVFVPSSSGDPSEAPDERDLDWEDYNYQTEPAAGGGRQAENTFAALQAGIPDLNTKEFKALLHNLPTQGDANQAAVMTMAEAVEVSYMFGRH